MRILLAIILLSSPCLACPRNSVDVNGVCAALPQPDESALAPEIGVVSDEKPPRHLQPEWQIGAVKANMGTLAVQDSSDTEHNYEAERNQK